MTTVVSPGWRDHLVQVVSHRALGFRAECLCGWAGPWGDDAGGADLAAREHRAITAGARRGGDTAFDSLLDLQDDLADTVVCLADAWSSDLPDPVLVPAADCRA